MILNSQIIELWIKIQSTLGSYKALAEKVELAIRSNSVKDKTTVLIELESFWHTHK